MYSKLNSKTNGQSSVQDFSTESSASIDAISVCACKWSLLQSFPNLKVYNNCQLIMEATMSNKYKCNNFDNDSSPKIYN